MIVIAKVVFLISFLSLVHSYVLYPLYLKIFASGKKLSYTFYDKQSLPNIAIIIAAFNEEKVIKEKLESIVKSTYPKEKMQVFVGSDNSTDSTNEIVNAFAKKYDFITFKNFSNRTGKSGILNSFFDKEQIKENYEVAILTDANVLFEENCIVELVKYFSDKKLGVVAANVINNTMGDGSVGPQERMYIRSENQLKINEGKVLQSSIGAFGACYAIRTSLLQKIPPNFLMEDFFLSMNTYNHKLDSITNESAVAYEDLPGDLNQEFTRKRRISAGNFQNLSVYYPLLFHFRKYSFAFFSHKVLRWFGPIALALAYVALGIIWFDENANQPYRTFFVIANVLLIMAILDVILHKFKVNISLFRLNRYFLLMNMALFMGLIDFITGVNTNIWKPTQREK